MNEDKPDLKMIHDLEQTEAAMVNIARLVGSYYKELVSQGLPEGLVVALVIDYQKVFTDSFRRRD